MVCNIMLAMMTKENRGMVTHCIRRAAAPISRTSGLSLMNSPTIWGAKIMATMATTHSTMADSRTQNQNASRTRR